MTTASQKDWKADFGLDTRLPPNLFTSTEELKPSTPQAHLLRRAFDLLDLDGVLCVDHSPLIYFKKVQRITAAAVQKLCQQFWNHGGAPILVLISDSDVHIYSGMSQPGQDMPSDPDEVHSHVETLKRVSESLRTFLTAVESGEYFHRHQKSFDPAQRVDRDLLDNLQAARKKLQAISPETVPLPVLDALLCRLVFTCYLFDRKVIDESYLNALGVLGAKHLRDVLAIQPRSKAKSLLYKLFDSLKNDFNGDLFSDDLKAEAKLVSDGHVAVLNDFFHGTLIRTGQRAFWPYDFEFIPIETISAIYERFLKEADEKVGAFYTPRFLAEVVLDIALADTPSLLGKRLLDPACGSGIFLVALFNRIAEEWRQANPRARNGTKAKELMGLLRSHLFGIDVEETACRITVFSLYLAYLDHLSPRDIQELQEKKHALPQLFVEGGNVQKADFFSESVKLLSNADIVIGNPPWGSIATASTPAGKWCAAHARPLPDKQIAAAFVWKAVEHLAEGGKVCFVLPHGLIFNHGTMALSFQKTWLEAHAIDCVLNLADLRFFLFEKAIHPAIVVRYQKATPTRRDQLINYWSPKADWTVTRAEVITIAPQDRTTIAVGEVLKNLSGEDGPSIWKSRYWATARDWRLLDRLSLYPRLRDSVGQPREDTSAKRWLIAEGFQPFGQNDPDESRRLLNLSNRRFIPARSEAIDLFILPDDCKTLPSASVEVRRLHSSPNIFKAPHVIVAKGFSSIAFAAFDVSFRHALRGIHGPEKDHDLLAFLAAYLRSSLAQYFLFHTTSNWGIYRPEVHVQELLRIPFPLPDQQPNSKRCEEIVREVAGIVTQATIDADVDLVDRAGIVQNASARIEPLVNEYFGILPLEKLLIDDTLDITIKSIQPTQDRLPVETVKAVSPAQLHAYCNRVCNMLSGWAKRGKHAVRGTTLLSESLGVGLAVFEKVERRDASAPVSDVGTDMLAALEEIRRAAPDKSGTLDLVRGTMAFLGNRLYLVKPIGQRQWTQTAAMNDADEIAGTILMRPAREGV